MDTCRYHTPHINTLDHEGYEPSEEFEYIAGERVPICSAPQMQQPGKVVGCSYALEQTQCPAYEADRQLVRRATNEAGATLELHTLRVGEGVRAYRVSLDGAPQATFTVHQHGQEAQSMAHQRFDDEVEDLDADEEEVESNDETISYLEKVLA